MSQEFSLSPSAKPANRRRSTSAVLHAIPEATPHFLSPEGPAPKSSRITTIAIVAISAAISFHIAAFIVLRDKFSISSTLAPVLPKTTRVDIIDSPPVTPPPPPPVPKETVNEIPEPVPAPLPTVEIPQVIPDNLDIAAMRPGKDDLGDAAPNAPAKIDIPKLAPSVTKTDLASSASLPALSTIAPNTNPITVNASTAPVDTDISGLVKTEISAGGSKSLEALTKIPPGELGIGSGHAALGADMLFPFNRYSLLQNARIDLIKLCALILQNPKTRVVIEGHTDSLGPRDYNVKLSLLRAKAVRDYLIAQNVPVSNVFISGVGPDRPLVAPSPSITNNEAEKQRQNTNRRVEIHFFKPNENLPAGDLKNHAWQPDFELGNATLR